MWVLLDDHFSVIWHVTEALVNIIFSSTGIKETIQEVGIVFQLSLTFLNTVSVLNFSIRLEIYKLISIPSRQTLNLPSVVVLNISCDKEAPPCAGWDMNVIILWLWGQQELLVLVVVLVKIVNWTMYTPAHIYCTGVVLPTIAMLYIVLLMYCLQ